ncbi:hypothetical protein [Streptomyces sp. NPDC002790]|uniref:hypothetical protein n=1 Tax=Streptomyces sp. NPDC002790 TaxID=3154431 RepID=UPI00332DA62A
MARHPEPRRITLGGRAAVALTLDEYEQLIAGRRQIGGQSARMRVLAQQAKRTEQLVRDLTELVAACPADECAAVGHTPSGTGPAVREDSPEAARSACVRCELAELLARHRGQGR